MTDCRAVPASEIWSMPGGRLIDGGGKFDPGKNVQLSPMRNSVRGAILDIFVSWTGARAICARQGRNIESPADLGYA